MNTLWLAFGIYILGITVVLFVRPAFMFRSGNGTWKEFGISNKDTYTVFPFWLFTLVWAILSYVFATMTTVFFAGLALQSLPSETLLTPISKVNSIPDIPVSRVPPTEVPGYYVLETPAKGQPKYVYFGTKPPTLANLPTDA